MTDDPILFDCPFCGSVPEYIDCDSREEALDGCPGVYCPACGAEHSGLGLGFDTRAQAAGAWNNRSNMIHRNELRVSAN